MSYPKATHSPVFDNATDADRKGLIQIITVGTATPYMDIVYGMKTDPDNYLKGRLGNLKGIHHHLFGWLDGFGELLTNLYAVGDFRLRRTGESIDAKIEMLKAMFATRYSNLRYELTEDDNYLRNATFDETMDGWTVQDDGKVITSNGEALLDERQHLYSRRQDRRHRASGRSQCIASEKELNPSGERIDPEARHPQGVCTAHAQRHDRPMGRCQGHPVYGHPFPCPNRWYPDRRHERRDLGTRFPPGSGDSARHFIDGMAGSCNGRAHGTVRVTSCYSTPAICTCRYYP